MRKRETSTSEFRSLLAEISMLLAYEVTRELPTHEVAAETPIGPTTIRLLDGKKIVLISIMRAGAGILDGMLRLLPSARVGHVGLYRDPKTLGAVGPSPATVVRCMTRRYLDSSHGRPRWSMHRLSHITRSPTCQRCV